MDEAHIINFHKTYHNLNMKTFINFFCIIYFVVGEIDCIKVTKFPKGLQNESLENSSFFATYEFHKFESLLFSHTNSNRRVFNFIFYKHVKEISNDILHDPIKGHLTPYFLGFSGQKSKKLIQFLLIILAINFDL